MTFCDECKEAFVNSPLGKELEKVVGLVRLKNEREK